jgi:peptide-methionine (S)-S-oxide reductase
MFEDFFSRLSRKSQMPTAQQALPGRSTAMPVTDRHHVLGTSLLPPFPPGSAELVVGMGCFWGAERKFWTIPGVLTTAVGYCAGFTPHPTYEEVCSGQTGHNEGVRVIYDPSRVSLEKLLQVFWESHDPTQGMRQGNDVGTQYRSGLYVSSDKDLARCEASRDLYQRALSEAGRPAAITTEILSAGPFYYAEDYHQQYLSKNPGGYCGLGGTGVCYRDA